MNKKNRLLRKWIAITVCCAIVAFGIPWLVTTNFLAEETEPIVIVLDPGHGGADVGAVNYTAGIYESDLNLAIALACRDELENYAGIEVHMTHTGIDYSQGVMSLGDRIAVAGNVQADILISLHCNDSENAAASGSEVYVSHSTYKQSYHQDSTELALHILEQFRDLGLQIRGVKTRLSDGHRMYYHDNGTEEIGDYYAVIGGPIKSYGIPGILVEHAFVKGDSAYLSNYSNLEALGIADATAIAKYYGLKLKSEVEEEVQQEQEEAEVIVITDADIVSASDVSNSLISLPEQLTTEHYEQLQQIRVEYEKLSYPAKTLVAQEEVDKLYHNILVLDSQVYPIRLVAVEQSELSVNRVNHTISGVVPETAEVRGTNAAELEAGVAVQADNGADTSNVLTLIIDINGNRMDIGDQVGTGTEIQLWKDGNLIDRLGVVIPCDISGDGRIDSLDQLMLEDYVYNGVQLSDVALSAADINGDKTVNSQDIDSLIAELLRQ